MAVGSRRLLRMMLRFILPKAIRGNIRFLCHTMFRVWSNFTAGRKILRKTRCTFFNGTKTLGRDQPDITGLIGQYAHGNEPSHHIAYLYNYADEPWKTQKLCPQNYGRILQTDSRRFDRQWRLRTNVGLVCFDRDWVFIKSIRLPVYAFGTPIFKEAKINLENGKTFAIKARNVSDKNIYINPSN